MRELTKSLLSFSWAMSLFGLRQASNLLSPGEARNPGGEAASRFQAVTRTAEEQLGPSFLSLFRAGDNFQRGAVELLFSLLRFDRIDLNRAARLGRDLLQQTAGAAATTAQAAAETAAETAQAAAQTAQQAAARVAPGWGAPTVGTPP